jgi:hypothetical protein
MKAAAAVRLRWALSLTLAAFPALAQDAGPAILTFADGSSMPLQKATLSYEYQSWKPGTAAFQAPTARKETAELLLGKKSYPIAKLKLEIVYTAQNREREIAGHARIVKVNVASGLTLTGADGKKTQLKLEQPVKEAFLPDAEKNTLFAVRTLDLRGETLTGTKRELCLVSFSSLVECPDDAAQQVTRIEFP